MTYFWAQFIHLTAAAFFIGGVFFEIMVVSPATRSLTAEHQEKVRSAVGLRARKLMPLVILALYGAGLTLAWHHREVLGDPFSSSFATLLAMKIAVALSILLHFITVITLMKTGRITPMVSRCIHYSVFGQMILFAVSGQGDVLPVVAG